MDTAEVRPDGTFQEAFGVEAVGMPGQSTLPYAGLAGPFSDGEPEDDHGANQLVVKLLRRPQA